MADREAVSVRGSSRPRLRLRPEGLSWRRFEHEIIILDLVGGVYFSLNGTGAALWEAIDAEDRSAAQLAELLCCRLSLEPARAESDVATFVATLYSHGLLER